MLSDVEFDEFDGGPIIIDSTCPGLQAVVDAPASQYFLIDEDLTEEEL